MGSQTVVRLPLLVCQPLFTSTRLNKQPQRKNKHRRREKKTPTRCHLMVYYTYNMLNMLRALLCPSSEARDYMLLTPMVRDALVAGCWRSGAGLLAMRPEWGMLREQHPWFRTHSQLSCTIQYPLGFKPLYIQKGTLSGNGPAVLCIGKVLTCSQWVSE